MLKWSIELTGHVELGDNGFIITSDSAMSYCTTSTYQALTMSCYLTHQAETGQNKYPHACGLFKFNIHLSFSSGLDCKINVQDFGSCCL